MRVLVLTEHDDAWGPAAAALLADYEPRWTVLSASTDPTPSFNDTVAAAMAECLIDLHDYHPRNAHDLDPDQFDLTLELYDLPTPHSLDEARIIRDDVKNKTYIWFKTNRKYIK